MFVFFNNKKFVDGLNPKELKSLNSFKKFLFYYYHSFPNTFFRKEDLRERFNIPISDETFNFLVKSGYFFSQKYGSKDCDKDYFSLGILSLNLINSWNIEKISRNTLIISICSFIISILILFLTIF